MSQIYSGLSLLERPHALTYGLETPLAIVMLLFSISYSLQPRGSIRESGTLSEPTLSLLVEPFFNTDPTKSTPPRSIRFWCPPRELGWLWKTQDGINQIRFDRATREGPIKADSVSQSPSCHLSTCMANQTQRAIHKNVVGWCPFLSDSCDAIWPTRQHMVVVGWNFHRVVLFVVFSRRTQTVENFGSAPTFSFWVNTL